jgi:polysaccharide export outer membrane protein
MWLKKRLPVLIVVSLAAISLFATDSAPQSTSPFVPSLVSKEQQPSNRVSPSQAPGAVSDPGAVRAADTLASVATPGSRAYRIGPLDVLDISVFQAPELSKTVQVAENGNIDLPLLGETPASGRTAQELQRELNAKLGAKYLQNPQVTVIVKEFNSSRVTVSGAVNNPGVFPYKGESLHEFVTMAGGLAFEANSTVIVLRTINGKRSATKFNIADIQAGRAPDQPVQSGDLIVADSSALKNGYNALLKMLPLGGAASTGVGFAR